jgi:KDO2-lipid IV(A) lauroyltransferase
MAPTGRSHFRHRVEVGAFRGARLVLGLLPETLALHVGALLGLIAASVLGVRRRAVDENLARAFPDAPAGWRARVARASYAHLGREAVMLFRIGRWSPERLGDRVVFRSGLDELRAALADGAGALVLTGHLGNWEVGGAALAARGLPVDAVYKRMANTGFELELLAERERLGMRMVEADDAPKQVLRGLRGGRIVAVVADQNAAGSGVFVPFFGTLASTARGPAVFALRTGAPVFAGVAIRRPGWRARYDVTIRRLPFAPTGDAEADIRALLGAFAKLLEEEVRNAPGQYFWQHRRWKTRPGSAQTLPKEEPPSGA